MFENILISYLLVPVYKNLYYYHRPGPYLEIFLLKGPGRPDYCA